MVEDDPHVRRYRRELEERAAERKAAHVPVVNLFDASATYDPKQGSATLAQIGDQQKRFEAGEAAPTAGLSASSIAGLTALRTEVQRMSTPQPAQPTPQAAPPAAPPVEKQPEPPKPVSRLSEVDELALERVLALAAPDTNDLINNPEQRAAIDARVSPISIAEGILNDEFTQDVPIVPGQLEVRFRTVSQEEDQQIRLSIFQKTVAEPRLEAISGELYRLLSLVSGIVRVNTEKLPVHYSRAGAVLNVNTEALWTKMNWLLAKPMALIHTLATHQYWFEQRVRKALTVGEAVKNG